MTTDEWTTPDLILTLLLMALVAIDIVRTWYARRVFEELRKKNKTQENALSLLFGSVKRRKPRHRQVIDVREAANGG